MNATSARELIVNKLVEYGDNMLLILTTVVGVALGFVLYKLGWGYIRNMPGDWTYDSQRASYRFGRGRNVKVRSGNLLA